MQQSTARKGRKEKMESTVTTNMVKGHRENLYKVTQLKEEGCMMAGPIMVYRAGGIRASIFENTVETHGTDVHTKLSTPSVKIQRCYKANGEWKTTDSFRVNDLPKVALVAQKAYEFLALTEPETGCEE